MVSSGYHIVLHTARYTLLYCFENGRLVSVVFKFQNQGVNVVQNYFLV